MHSIGILYFKIKCIGDRPSAPGKPYIELPQNDSNGYKVSWNSSVKNNGAEVEMYFLERKEMPDSIAPIAQQQRSSREAPNEFEDNDGWTLSYSGSSKLTNPH